MSIEQLNPFDDPWVHVGDIIRPHGVHGQCKVRWHISPGELIALPQEFYVQRLDGRSTVCAVRTPINVLQPRPLVALVDILSVEDATPLKGAKLLVKRSLLPALGTGELYLFDLVGCQAFDVAHNPLGFVAGIQDYGAGPLITLQRHRCEPGHLAAEHPPVQLVDETIVSFDRAARRVVLRLGEDG